MIDSSTTQTIGASGDADYRIELEARANRVRVEFNNTIVADSREALVMHETRRPPVYYFPRSDVRVDLMHRTSQHTHCPFRGNASYWTLRVGERVAEDAVWSYEDPFEDAVAIKDYVAFYADRMDAWYEDDQTLAVTERPANLAPHPNPFVNWLIADAPALMSTPELVTQLAERINASGIPLLRLFMAIRTLHPQLTGTSYVWSRGGEPVSERLTPHAVLQEPGYLNSPLAPIFDGAGGIRRRLEGDDPRLDFPILGELREEGATDYVAMPLLFSDGRISAISLATDAPGGFSTEELGHLYEILPVLSRLFEVHSLRRSGVTLLETYLGKQSGGRVLDGLIKRGDGDNIHAVIWFSDLRESTPLADSMSREDFLGLLNKYFDCTAGAVLEHGGEVLRFIGDAALSIFPIGQPTDEASDLSHGATLDACKRALAAAREARRRLAAVNHKRAARGRQTLESGLALHLGDVTYGNIGTENRLEFTVVGAAANEAARIESMSKTLHHPILLSARFASFFPGQFKSLGVHSLRGVGEPQEIFTLSDGEQDEESTPSEHAELVGQVG